MTLLSCFEWLHLRFITIQRDWFFADVLEDCRIYGELYGLTRSFSQMISHFLFWVWMRIVPDMLDHDLRGLYISLRVKFQHLLVGSDWNMFNFFLIEALRSGKGERFPLSHLEWLWSGQVFNFIVFFWVEVTFSTFSPWVRLQIESHLSAPYLCLFHFTVLGDLLHTW